MAQELPDGIPVAIAFHNMGTYAISATGASTKLPQGSTWGMSCIAIPISDETLLVLHGMGIYKVSVETGACEQIASSSWSEAKMLVAL